MPAPKLPVLRVRNDSENADISAYRFGQFLRPVSRLLMRVQDIYGLHDLVQLFVKDPKNPGMEKPYSPQLMNSQSAGEIDVIIRDLQTNPKIAVVLKQRDTPAHPDLYEYDWEHGYTPDPMTFLEKLGMQVLELPRGLSEPGSKLGSEGEEEFVVEIIAAVEIGRINTDTACMVTSPRVVLCETNAVAAAGKKDEHEAVSVTKLLWYTPDEIQKMDTICGMTKGALWTLRSYLLNLDSIEPDNKPWIRLGNLL